MSIWSTPLSNVTFRNYSKVELIDTNASDLQVARAAWVSTVGEDAREKENGRVEGLINFLWREKHTSPFEHGSWTFLVNTPIFVAREAMRHRTGAYNEWSGRYSDLKPEFYLPSADRPLRQVGKVGQYSFEPGTSDQYAILQTHFRGVCQRAWDGYMAMKEAGIANEVARDVLPVGIFTTYYVTMNTRNLMHFLDLRTAPNALEEIRRVAGIMEASFKERMPLTYKAWKDNK